MKKLFNLLLALSLMMTGVAFGQGSNYIYGNGDLLLGDSSECMVTKFAYNEFKTCTSIITYASKHTVKGQVKDHVGNLQQPLLYLKADGDSIQSTASGGNFTMGNVKCGYYYTMSAQNVTVSKPTLKDLLIMKNYLYGSSKLTAIQKVAGDIDGDKKITTNDWLTLSKMANGTYVWPAKKSRWDLVSGGITLDPNDPWSNMGIAIETASDISNQQVIIVILGKLDK